jgi:ABC-type transport system substrate-binding protein
VKQVSPGNPPFDDINIRKTVIHAIKKVDIVEKELKGVQPVVDNVFPLEAPFCDVDLTPLGTMTWKRPLLFSCIDETQVAASSDSSKSDFTKLAVGLGLAGFAAVSLYRRSKKFEFEFESEP